MATEDINKRIDVLRKKPSVLKTIGEKARLIKKQIKKSADLKKAKALLDKLQH